MVLTLQSGVGWFGELGARRGAGRGGGASWPAGVATIAGAASKGRARKNRWPLAGDGRTGPPTAGGRILSRGKEEDSAAVSPCFAPC